MGARIGWVDAHLLAAAALTRTKLWSLDATLARTAHRLDLAPDEMRSETFALKMPAGKPGRVDATFYYFHPATADPEKSGRIKFLELSKSLP